LECLLGSKVALVAIDEVLEISIVWAPGLLVTWMGPRGHFCSQPAASDAY
jgi:hypothetical protein